MGIFAFPLIILLLILSVFFGVKSLRFEMKQENNKKSLLMKIISLALIFSPLILLMFFYLFAQSLSGRM